MSQKILVVGATGMLGEPVAKRFKEEGFNVRIMTRDVEKAKRIFGPDYEIVEGDLFNANQLRSCISGCNGIHINLSGEIEQIGVERIVDASKDQGIEHLTYISGTSVSEDTIWFPQTKRKFMAEKAIKDSGIPYTIFCPAWFMESLPRFVREGKAFVFGRQPNPYHFVAADDYAKMVVGSYNTDKALNKRLFIHGPEGLLFHDALRRYCSVFHPEIDKITTLPYWFAKIIAWLRKSEEMKEINEFMHFFEKAGERGNPTGANRILGAPKTTLDMWLNRRKEKEYKES